MAMETRIRLTGIQSKLDECHDGKAPLEVGPSYVRFLCALTVKYSTRRLGGGGVAVPLPLHDGGVRQFTMTMQTDVRPVDNPLVFLDHDETRRVIWGMVTRLPGLDRYDLSRGNWESTTTPTPDNAVATWIHGLAHANLDRGLRVGHYRVVVFIRVEVELVFSEPKAVVAATTTRVHSAGAGGGCCCVAGKPCGICLDDLVDLTAVKLPCGHAFHGQCITNWLFEGKTCPMCRRDLTGLVDAPSRYQLYNAPTIPELVQLGWTFISSV
uniref:RING-type domain-containing protein n=1 Tax=Oryza punctata TaxID=4537 RepID=A0A0E0JJT9_ORYPU